MLRSNGFSKCMERSRMNPSMKIIPSHTGWNVRTRTGNRDVDHVADTQEHEFRETHDQRGSGNTESASIPLRWGNIPSNVG